MNRYDDAYAALGAVIDPELDEPITDLGFVRSLVMTGGDVEVHLRLPTSFCAPNFAYLMASDAKDALTKLDWTEQVVVELDDHHDSDIINAGLATDAGYRGTFGHEADSDLDDLRLTFQRKAHTAAMERCLTQLLRSDPNRPEASLGRVVLRDLPDHPTTVALLRRRAVLGLSLAPHSLVMVDHSGRGYGPDDVPLGLRRARSTRISIDGNAHFCRGLLRTRYPAESAAAQRDPTSAPLTTLTVPN
jgi:metal-sulfur cluster biosynthetic enzyme